MGDQRVRRVKNEAVKSGEEMQVDKNGQTNKPCRKGREGSVGQ